MTRRLVLLVVVSLGVLSLMLGLATVGAAMLPEFPSWTSILMDRESTYGWDVASAGDVNGDGFADVIVTGAYYKSEESESQEGKAWIFAGSADGLGTVAMWYFESNNPNALFGMSADTAGDVNGDGFADIVVGAPRYKEPDWPNTRGAVYVFHGSPDGPSTEPDSLFTTTVEHPGARVGNSVAGTGDIDGDGYDDIAVGAECYSIDDVVCRGAFFVYYGSPDGLVDDPDIVPTARTSAGTDGTSRPPAMSTATGSRISSWAAWGTPASTSKWRRPICISVPRMASNRSPTGPSSPISRLPPAWAAALRARAM